MASLIDTLIEILDSENTEYNKLLELSKEKTTAIVNGNVELLQTFLSKEQKLIKGIDELEKKRQDNVLNICKVLNLSPNDIKVSSIIDLLSRQKDIQKALNESYVRLKRTVNELMTINENNKLLIKESMDMIDFELNLAKNAMIAPETGNYGKGAYEESPSVNSVAGRFDAKQ